MVAATIGRASSFSDGFGVDRQFIVYREEKEKRKVRRVRMLGLCLVALLALAVVVAVGSASAAEPEWGACYEQSKGHYSNSTCTTEAAYKESKKTHEKKYKGKYEWKGGAPVSAECYKKKGGNYLTSACNTEKEKKGVPEEHKGKYEKGGPKFAGEGGAGVLLAEIYTCESGFTKGADPQETCEDYYRSFGHAKVECTSEHANGEAVGADEVANISVRFKGCSIAGLAAQTPGLPSGEIATTTLKGKLGYIKKSNHEVGVLLEPTTAEGLFAEFETIEGLLIERVGVGNATEGAFYEEPHTPGVPSGHDGVISPITPVNAMTHTFTQNYRVEEGRVPCKAEGACGGLGEVNRRAEPFFQRNVPSSFEGGQLEALEVQQGAGEGKSAWSPAGQEITNVNTVEGEAEIKA